MKITLGWLSHRRKLAAAYKTLFVGGQTGMHIDEARAVVLKDLSHICRAKASTYVKGDANATIYLEGRREIWLRIQLFSSLSEEQLRRYEAQLEGEGS